MTLHSTDQPVAVATSRSLHRLQLRSVYLQPRTGGHEPGGLEMRRWQGKLWQLTGQGPHLIPCTGAYANCAGLLAQGECRVSHQIRTRGT